MKKFFFDKRISRKKKLFFLIGYILMIYPAVQMELNAENIKPSDFILNEIKKTALPQSSERQTIKGRVIDEHGESLPGVAIQIEGTPRGVTTDVDGTFTIEAKPSDKLKFSYLGMEDQIVAVGSKKEFIITLKMKVDELQEVTVVAFAKQKKESVIGSITTVKPADLKIPSSNLTNALAGKVAGMISYQRSGEPGQDNADFFIRGVTTFGYKKDPLILIDNVEVSNTDLARLQVDDIESFSIMKDATSTALYGARGANGVILVTTKQGAEGKAKVSIRVENSISTPTQEVKLADPITYMRLANEAILTRDPLGLTPYSDQKIDNTIAGVNPYMFPSTDWKNELMTKTAMNQRVNLSVSGGGKVARYYVAGSFNQSNGNLKVNKQNNFNNNIDLKSYTIRSNVNINITPTTEMIVRLSGSFDDYTGPIDGGTTVYKKIMRTNPVLFPPSYPKDEEHKHTQHILFGNYGEGDYLNPYADMVKGYKEYSRSNMGAQFELKQKMDFITKGLSIRAMLNTTRNAYFDLTRAYSPFYYQAGSYDKLANQYRLNMLNEGEGTEYLDYTPGEKTVSSNLYLEAAVNYDRIFAKKHAVNGLLVFQLRNNQTGNSKNLEDSLPFRNVGLSGRATYAFDSRYFVEFNFGYNGSERFYKTFRWGFFPSFGGGWLISNEAFYGGGLKKVMDKLKLKMTYGLVGNDNIGEGRFLYMSNVNMKDSDRKAVFGKENGYSKDGISLSRYSNPAITWETSKKINLGIEATFFKNLEIQAEIFRERRNNILMTRASTPATMGLSAQPQANVGEAQGQGLDMSVDYNHVINKDWWVQGRFNFTYATSKYIYYEEPVYDATPWKSRVGYPLSQSWGYIAERLFVDDKEVANSPYQSFGQYAAGDIKFRDINGDGQITSLDQVPIGHPTSPEIVYGFGVSVGYKNIDFSCFFQGLARESFSIDVKNTSPFIDPDSDNKKIDNNQLLKVYADSHWSEDNRNLYAIWPRLSGTLNNNNAQNSTWFMRDGSFLRLKNVEIGYAIPRSWEKKIGLRARLYLSGTNLLTFSKFKLWDPEMAGNGLGYPIQRVYNIGLNVQF